MKKIENKIVIYQGKNGEIKFKGDFTKDTIWGTQKQIADIFDTTKQNISLHLSNIFKEKELNKKVTVKKSLTVQNEGDRKVSRKTEFYNLDAIISVGYRINSKKATEFRIWATKTLKKYITKGYTINREMIGKNYQSFMDVVEKVQNLLPKGDQIPAENVLELIKSFASTWFSLESYDDDKLPKSGFTKKDLKIQSQDLYNDILKFKKRLINKKRATKLFAQEKQKNNLEGIIGNIYQTAFSSEVYKTIEDKAAHLLYFIVKNHPFIDGNKRVGAFTFIWYLQKVKFQYRNKITPEALTAITLFVAQSNPSEKDKMIGLILLLLKK